MPRRSEEKLHDIGSPRSRNCINAPSRDHIYYVFTPRQWSHYWKSCMMESMVVIKEEGPFHIELSPKGIGGLACKGPLRIMLENVNNVKDTLQISII